MKELNTVEHEDGKKKVLVYGVNGVQGRAVARRLLGPGTLYAGWSETSVGPMHCAERA